MRDYLVDTNILLWAWHRPDLVPARMARIFASGDPYHVSIATFWEIAIRVSIGKLKTVADPIARAIETNCRILEIQPVHIQAVQRLPLHHRDPFDRMLIAQAQVEKFVVLTHDRQFAAYDVELA